MNHKWIFKMSHDTSTFLKNMFSVLDDQYEDRDLLMHKAIILWLVHFPEVLEFRLACTCQILPVRVTGAGPCECKLQRGRPSPGRCWTWGTGVGWGGAGTSKTPLEGLLGSPASQPQCCLCLYCYFDLPTDLERGEKKLHNLWLEASIVRHSSKSSVYWKVSAMKIHGHWIVVDEHH